MGQIEGDRMVPFRNDGTISEINNEQRYEEALDDVAELDFSLELYRKGRRGG